MEICVTFIRRCRVLKVLGVSVLVLFPASLFCEEPRDIPPNPESSQQNSASASAPNNLAVAGQDGVTYASCLSCPEPSTTKGARKRHVSGNVVMQVIVQPNGRATDIQLIQGLDPELDKKALAAVQKWRFKPALGRDGKPVATKTMIQQAFR
jgi:TonB family protein